MGYRRDEIDINKGWLISDRLKTLIFEATEFAEVSEAASCTVDSRDVWTARGSASGQREFEYPGSNRQ